MRGDVEHLLAGKDDLHRPLQLARRERRQDGVLVERPLPPKPPPTKRDHRDVLGRNMERLGERVVGDLDDLHGAVDGELAVLH